MLGSSPARFAALPASGLEALPMLTDGGGHGGGRVLQSLAPDNNAMPEPDFGGAASFVLNVVRSVRRAFSLMLQ